MWRRQARRKNCQMIKRRRKVSTVLPTYQRDRYRWRRNILANVLKAANKAGVRYDQDDQIEVVVLLYLCEGKASHDS